uniref:4-nitrophenylphosphatase n=1 Tax=Ditylenchus dipsaci TaxID=166011 RepID=A0A915CSB7_9BILA
MSTVQKALVTQIWDSYDTFIFDADGVLWIAGKLVLIMTNNSTKTPKDYVEKCQKLGFTSLKEENLVSAGLVAAHELKKLQQGETLDPNERSGISSSIEKNLPIYLVGTTGLQKILKDYAGIESFGPGPDHLSDHTDETFMMDIDMSKKASAVVCINYLKDPKVHFIATNEDLSFPGNVPGIVVPGAGCVSSVLRAVSGREPIVMGKPHTAAFNYIRERFHIDEKRTLMVGDRCDTDIWFGTRHGLDTMIVLTGIHQLKDLKYLKQPASTS